MKHDILLDFKPLPQTTDFTVLYEKIFFSKEVSRIVSLEGSTLLQANIGDLSSLRDLFMFITATGAKYQQTCGSIYRIMIDGSKLHIEPHLP